MRKRKPRIKRKINQLENKIKEMVENRNEIQENKLEKNVKRDGDCKQQKRKNYQKLQKYVERQEKQYSDMRNEGKKGNDKASGRNFFGRGTKRNNQSKMGAPNKKQRSNSSRIAK